MYMYNKYTIYIVQWLILLALIWISKLSQNSSSVDNVYSKNETMWLALEDILKIIISSNTNIPIYEQITSQIKNMIMSEEPVSYTHLTLPTKRIV